MKNLTSCLRAPKALPLDRHGWLWKKNTPHLHCYLLYLARKSGFHFFFNYTVIHTYMCCTSTLHIHTKIAILAYFGPILLKTHDFFLPLSTVSALEIIDFGQKRWKKSIQPHGRWKKQLNFATLCQNRPFWPIFPP